MNENSYDQDNFNQAQSEAQTAQAYDQPTVTQSAASGEMFDAADVEKNKTMAGLAYLLFFLPLISCPESRYAKFHANQGLLLLIFSIGGSFVLGLIPVLGWFLLLFYPIVMLIFGIMGLVNGFQGKAKRLPLFGKINIIKY
jgi:uncharacterized membrane protein